MEFTMEFTWISWINRLGGDIWQLWHLYHFRIFTSDVIPQQRLAMTVSHGRPNKVDNNH